MNDVFAQPVGCDREGQHVRRAPVAPIVSYAAAATAGGAATGGAIGWLAAASAEASQPVAIVLGTALALLAAAAQLAELRGRRVRTSARAGQVPRRWTLWRRKWRTAAAFGVLIGSGLFTHFHHAAGTALAVVICLTTSAIAGAAIGAAYGATLGGVLVGSWARGGLIPAGAVGRANAHVATVALFALATAAAAAVVVP